MIKVLLDQAFLSSEIAWVFIVENKSRHFEPLNRSQKVKKAIFTVTNDLGKKYLPF